MNNLAFITYNELKEFLKFEGDDNKNLYENDILVATAMILNIVNQGTLSIDWINDSITPSDKLIIKQATKILCKSNVENGTYKKQQSLSANLGALNISQNFSGDQQIPEDVYRFLEQTKYYSELIFLNDKTPLNPGAIDITTDQIDRSDTVEESGRTLTDILNNIFTKTKNNFNTANMALVLATANEGKTTYLNSDGTLDNPFIPTSKIPASMKDVATHGGGGASNFSDLDNDTGINISPEFPQNGKGLMLQIGKDIGTLESSISNVDNELEDYKYFEERVEAFNNLEPPDLIRQEVIYGSNYQNTNYTQNIQMTKDRNEYPIQFPDKSTSRLIDYITISPDKLHFLDAEYLFKNLFFIKLSNVKISPGNTYMTGKFIFRIKDKDSNITNADEYVFKGKNDEIIEAFCSLSFSMLQTKAPYTIEVAFFLDEATIDNVGGDPANFEVVSTATTNIDTHIIRGGSVNVWRYSPYEDTRLVQDTEIHFKDPNVYTAEGYKLPILPDGSYDDSLPPLLIYAISNVPYIETVKKAFKLGEDGDGNITKAEIESASGLSLANKKLTNLGEGTKATEGITYAQLQTAIHSENKIISKVISASGTSENIPDPTGNFDIQPDGTVDNLWLKFQNLLYATGKTYLDCNTIKLRLRLQWNTGQATQWNDIHEVIFIQNDGNNWTCQSGVIVKIAGTTERQISMSASIGNGGSGPEQFIIDFGTLSDTNLSNVEGKKIYAFFDEITPIENETGGGSIPPIAIEGFVNQQFQTLASDTYPGDIDDTLRAITGWTNKLKNKTLFTIQSNGALVIDEAYRQEIEDGGKDRYLRVDFSCQGWTNRTGIYKAVITTSGAFDFNGNKTLIERDVNTSSNSYLGSMAQEIHSLYFRIPHTLASGDLMYVEIQAINCGVADMRPPYNLIFTELGTAGVQGPKGDQGPKGEPGTPGGAGVREVMYDETQTIDNNGFKDFNIIPTAKNNNFKNVMFLINCTHKAYSIVFSLIEFLDNDEFYIYKTHPADNSYTFLEIFPEKGSIKLYNLSNFSMDFKVKATGERITTTREKVKR